MNKNSSNKAMKSLDFMFENSIFLILGAIAALLIVNLGGAHWYHTVIHHEIAWGASLHFITNDLLMAFFFLLAGKEVFEAFLPGGDLSSPKKAITPLIATAGGVLGPVAVYMLLMKVLNVPELQNGWAIPTATDIAFAGLFASFIFGKDHPARTFLLLLAIVDDGIGLIILAVFYPSGDMNMTIFIASIIGAIFINQIIIKKVLKKEAFGWYLVIAGPLVWYGFHMGGIHPALALIVLVPTIPHAKADGAENKKLTENAEDQEDALNTIKATHTIKKSPMYEDTDEDHGHDALSMLEHKLKPYVEIILMLFGFANAGVLIETIGTSTTLVTAGLLVGKPLGIFLMGYISVKVFKTELPDGMNFVHLFLVGVIAGIGFTVALFVSGIAFPAGSIQDAAKIGALISFSSGFIAVFLGKLFKIKKIIVTDT